MKLRNLIFTIPAIASAAPILVATANCSCSKYNPKLEGDCAKYVEITKKSNFKINSKYELEIQIKQEYVNEYFLPEYIPYIMCGYEEIYPSIVSWTDTYFDYEVDKTHTWAKITINNIPGRVTLDFEMEKISNLIVQLEDSFEDNAFFDVGQIFNTDNVKVILFLTDGSEILVSKNYYSVESEWVGHPFTTDDVGKTKDVKITYQGKKEKFSDSYTAKCVTKSVVKMDGERYPSIPDAIKAFEDSNKTGSHIARIIPGNYELDKTLTIPQQTDKTLILTSDFGDVNLSLKDADATSNLIEITPATDTPYSCTTLLNLNFNKPKLADGKTLSKHNFVYANQANGVEVIGCELNGIEGDDANKINAIECVNAQNIRVGLCTSNFINSYVTGTIKHYSGQETRVNYDILIDRCEATNQVSIGSVKGDDITTFMNGTTGGFFYAPNDKTTSEVSSAFKLTGKGDIRINECLFKQLRPGKDTSYGNNAFIEVETSDASKVLKTISVWNSYFVKTEEAPVYDLYNSGSATWTYQVDASASKEIATDEKIYFGE